MTAEVQWSELARDARAVARQVDDAGEVRVRRRDGVPLVLRRADFGEQLGVGFMVAARALRNALAHLAPTEAAAALQEEFPWVEVLPAVDRAQFVADFVRTAQAAAELGRSDLLAKLVTEWKNTALVFADADVLSVLSQSLDVDHGPVPNPGEQ